MNFSGYEENTGGDEALYTRDIHEYKEDGLSGGAPVPGLQPQDLWQPAAFWFPQADGYQPIFGPEQEGQPLYADNFFPPYVAEHQGYVVNGEYPQLEPIGELEHIELQPFYAIPPLAIPAIPAIPLAIPVVPAIPVELVIPIVPVIPVIPIDAAHGNGHRPGQEFRCKSNCRGVFTGPHKCTHRGRSLTISCRGGNDGCESRFSKRTDFNRHCDSVHRDARAGVPVKRLLDCPVAGCERVGEDGFKRKDNLTQHRRSVHGEDIAKNPIRFGGGGGAA